MFKTNKLVDILCYSLCGLEHKRIGKLDKIKNNIGHRVPTLLVQEVIPRYCGYMWYTNSLHLSGLFLLVCDTMYGRLLHSHFRKEEILHKKNFPSVVDDHL